METILQTNQLVRRFGGLVAVNQVNFSLEKGEVRGLIGPNGSGKTTLINIITGVYEPTSGNVTFNNENISGLPPNQIARKGVLRTFQVPRLFGSMSVIDNMLITRFANFSLDYRKHYDAAVAQADELLITANLMHLRDEKAKILSGGQKALVQFMRAFMVNNLQVLLLDEPFAGVNVIVKETMMDMIIRKAAEGITFLVVSHEMTSIRRLCPRVTVLAEGAVITEGSMDQIVANEQVISAYLGG
jgi:ABC-type branched-subunit amino acid transport system ATPase component